MKKRNKTEEIDYSSTTSWSPFPHKGRLSVIEFICEIVWR